MGGSCYTRGDPPRKEPLLPEPFAITTTITAVPLDAQRQAQVSFTVSNTSGRALAGHGRVEVTDQATESWLTVVGDAERDFPAAGTSQYTVRIVVPPGAAPGTYAFRFDMVGVDNPDDEYTQGPSVTFTVPAAGPAVRPFPWWIPVVVGVVLLVIVAASIFLVAQNNANTHAHQTQTAQAVLAAVTPTAACVPLPPGLTAWYSGDGNTADRLGGPAGVAQGGVSFIPGEVGQAFSFNGADAAVNFGPVGNFGTSDFTVELWINTAAPRQAGIIGNRNDNCGGQGGQWIDLRSLNTGGIFYELGGFPNYSPLTSAPNRLGDGKFHHVAAVRQGARQGLYVDGQLDQFINTGSVFPINNTTGLIAGKSACTGRDNTGFLAGALDEIAIYNRALTAQEIQGIFQAGGTPRCPAPAH